MASKRKDKSNSRRPPVGRNGSLDSSQEVFVPERVDTGADFVPKEPYLLLLRAFNDVKKKLISARNEKEILHEKINALVKNVTFLENKVEFCASIEKENETLKEKVGLGFQAFDKKYKEYENLKKELQTIKEGLNKQAEDRGEEQQDLAVQKEETATQTKASFDPAREENKTVESSTQTSEEKTDEVGCVPSSTPTKLLRNCGLEIVQQDGNFYLFLSERDLLKQWLENETDGKVSVAFEKTPVCERFVQTDIKKMTEEIPCVECLENKTIIIHLKNKIVDQANSIKRYREQLANMAGLLQNTPESKKVSSFTVAVQTEGKFYDEVLMNKQVKSLAKYKNKVSQSMHVLEQKLIQLNKELEYEKKFSNRLLVIINSTMEVPGKFISSVLTAVQGKSSGKIKKDKKPPVPRAFLEEVNLEYSKPLSPPESFASTPMLSLPVQETDRRLRVKISKPRDPDYDPSLDEEASSVAPAESRSLTSESSASIVPAEEAQHTLVVDNIIISGSSDVQVLPTSPISGASSNSQRIEQASAHDDDGDEIVVIEENETGAVGNISGAKECPICYLLYTPETNQREYEKHVMDHFKDFD
ncbi:uncharacterized protein LOC116293466 [Actinia tenebrosa]|uniref:Uncharacterized protein LOC116293466 n=1 Tax=Actinia tenebrosa TaxID=6105 RepID=A0A6P8HVY3_ACTTE|nr:uncharacterized protein LOC116293466 [Actinia tenebrosa]